MHVGLMRSALKLQVECFYNLNFYIMTTALKIANILLILFATYMGIKQGWAMLVGKPAMIEMFRAWNLGRMPMVILGFFAVLSAFQKHFSGEIT